MKPIEDQEDEPIGPLEGEVPIERVVVMEETRLYRAKAVLAYFDSPVFDLSRTSFSCDSDPVEVYDASGRRIGFARVEVDQTWGGSPRIVADISIDYATEERFLAETKSEKIYARFFGRLTLPATPLFDFHKPLVPSKLSIDGVMLTRDRPTDPRLEPFGGLVL